MHLIVYFPETAFVNRSHEQLQRSRFPEKHRWIVEGKQASL